MSDQTLNSSSVLVRPKDEVLSRLRELIAEGMELMRRCHTIPNAFYEESEESQATELAIVIWRRSVALHLERSFSTFALVEEFKRASNNADYQPPTCAAEAIELDIKAKVDVLRMVEGLLERDDIRALHCQQTNKPVVERKVALEYKRLVRLANAPPVPGISQLVRDCAGLAKLLGDRRYEMLFDEHLSDRRTGLRPPEVEVLNDSRWAIEAYIEDRTFERGKTSPVALAALEEGLVVVRALLSHGDSRGLTQGELRMYHQTESFLAFVTQRIHERVARFLREHGEIPLRYEAARQTAAGGIAPFNPFQESVLREFLVGLSKTVWLRSVPNGGQTLALLVDKYDREEFAELVIDGLRSGELHLDDVLRASLPADAFQNLVEMVWAIATSDSTLRESQVLLDCLRKEYDWLGTPRAPRGVSGGTSARDARLAHERRRKEEREEIEESRKRVNTVKTALAHAHPKGWLFPDWNVESQLRLRPLPKLDDIVVELHPGDLVSLRPEHISRAPVSRNLWYELRTSNTAIVFVHGFCSDSYRAWYNTEASVFWPDIVRADPVLNHTAIFLGGFEANVWSTDYGISECAAELFAGLKNSGIFAPLAKKRILFVCHSLGGVVVRYMLEKYRIEFAGKRIGLFLVASPSMGSGAASLLAELSGPYGRKIAKELRRNGDLMIELDGRFRTLREEKVFSLCGRELIEQKPWKIWRKTLGVILPFRPRLVSPESASRYFGQPFVVPNSDHTSIAKPNGMDHPSHVQLRLFFSETFEGDEE